MGDNNFLNRLDENGKQIQTEFAAIIGLFDNRVQELNIQKEILENELRELELEKERAHEALVREMEGKKEARRLLAVQRQEPPIAKEVD